MGEIPANVPFKVIFDGEDVAFWNIPLNKHYWVIEKDKPIPNSFFDLQHDINLLMEENKKLKKENKELKKESYGNLDGLESYKSLYSDVCEKYDNLEADYDDLKKENEQLKKELKRCKDWINSDKNDYELTLSFIKNKGYSLKDVLEYEKELKSE